MGSNLDFDPGASEVMNDPFAAYADRRARCPVGHVGSGPVPFYVVFRYEDVRDVQTDATRFTSRFGSNPSYRDPQTIYNDGAEHMAFRKLFATRFTPRGIAAYEAAVKDIASELVDRMMAAGDTAELYSAYATPLPVAVIAHILGLAGEDYGELKRVADAMIDLSWTPNPDAWAQHYRRLCAMFDRHIDARLATLKVHGVDRPNAADVGTLLPDDSISDLVIARVHDKRPLMRSEMHFILMALFLGGNETTTFLITNCIWRLIEDRSRWERLAADPDRYIPNVIEESLRHDPPNLGLWRTTACPVQIAGHDIPANAKIQMSYASANRDPAVFTDPDTFRMDRPQGELRKHLAFGTGAHVCIGQYLSRMEMAVTLRLFLERMPRLRLDGPTERLENFGFWGRRKLPVTWA